MSNETIKTTEERKLTAAEITQLQSAIDNNPLVSEILNKEKASNFYASYLASTTKVPKSKNDFFKHLITLHQANQLPTNDQRLFVTELIIALRKLSTTHSAKNEPSILVEDVQSEEQVQTVPDTAVKDSVVPETPETELSLEEWAKKEKLWNWVLGYKHDQKNFITEDEMHDLTDQYLKQVGDPEKFDPLVDRKLQEQIHLTKYALKEAEELAFTGSEESKKYYGYFAKLQDKLIKLEELVKNSNISSNSAEVIEVEPKREKIDLNIESAMEPTASKKEDVFDIAEAAKNSGIPAELEIPENPRVDEPQPHIGENMSADAIQQKIQEIAKQAVEKKDMCGRVWAGIKQRFGGKSSVETLDDDSRAQIAKLQQQLEQMKGVYFDGRLASSIANEAAAKGYQEKSLINRLIKNETLKQRWNEMNPVVRGALTVAVVAGIGTYIAGRGGRKIC
jgi:hypothetical protein